MFFHAEKEEKRTIPHFALVVRYLLHIMQLKCYTKKAIRYIIEEGYT